MFGKIVAVIGLAVLLIIHFFIRDRIKYDIGWLLHLSGGFFLAMLWLSAARNSSVISLLVFVAAVSLFWEILELFYFGGKIFTWHRCLDAFLPLLGAAVYNLLAEVF